MLLKKNNKLFFLCFSFFISGKILCSEHNVLQKNTTNNNNLQLQIDTEEKKIDNEQWLTFLENNDDSIPETQKQQENNKKQQVKGKRFLVKYIGPKIKKPQSEHFNKTNKKIMTSIVVIVFFAIMISFIILFYKLNKNKTENHSDKKLLDKNLDIAGEDSNLN